ncbi:hypothetical protein V6C42_08395 [Pseudoclostridium thermosuccinogenes]|uniref:type III toxin-antitoxin system CptIN family toxin n=1 Tax=Clostridium thermosuccinogenes TaxID=84032 RepID=UPI00187453F3|nr:hypothetical protein [Pseudoclostridium thermosuccinogenes]
MQVGNFYFLDDSYFTDFRDEKLMGNKETVQNTLHDRPCFYAIYDESTSLYWLIPISSKVSKFKSIYQDKINRYGKCDTIAFGYVLGHEKAFLIQNMCPVLPCYIKNEYKDSKANVPVRVDGIFEKELISKAKKVLALQRKGIKLIFPDVLKIEKELMKKLDKPLNVDLSTETAVENLPNR